jgi:hypothetical protein
LCMYAFVFGCGSGCGSACVRVCVCGCVIVAIGACGSVRCVWCGVVCVCGFRLCVDVWGLSAWMHSATDDAMPCPLGCLHTHFSAEQPTVGKLPPLGGATTALQYCTAQHSTALHCTTLHYTALHCTALHRSAPHCTAQHYNSVTHCTPLNFPIAALSPHTTHSQLHHSTLTHTTQSSTLLSQAQSTAAPLD